MARNERGQLLPFIAILVLLLGGTVLALGRLAEASAHRSKARTAADAAALAGAAEGEPAARRLAEANGARLVAFHRRDGTIWVTVEHGPAVARASAERTLISTGPGG